VCGNPPHALTVRINPMNKQAKIQSLIIKHLLDHGTLDILLPDGIVLEIGITHENKNGDRVKSDDYCYVVASRDNKKTLLDSYNLGLSFTDEDDTIVFEDKGLDEKGIPIRRVDVI
jgi:hypothetical protein